MEIRGNYPFAVLHAYKTEGFNAARLYAQKVSKETLTSQEAAAYVAACVKTNGQPKLLDLFVDYEAIGQEAIKRFPKILGKLAE